ncbi:L,D-transpeptidase family protein [Bradyrhizobium sp. ISRA443]|uniref:L,D-transpeptidase family protein n=1 Tax=unclassified Bradyrhizobium TaxID=2631580 RepID=UPI00247886B6|nr:MULTISPECIES: L,D-transpeptidase family protein [unclassified Bradyrhizobium]WGS01692.1 L,D-transpeptidase family protein [Bradyrhizobium sp. ISRA436]WGS08578.1 L,D-transpeptidase family protein [Bradyrhizobium sp. ISRA437]WGS15466.1 L,D-transpeptidase family protein [Bradyrhizobium sp. ISRA443]
MFRSLAIVLLLVSAEPAIAARLDAASINDAAAPAKMPGHNQLSASIAKLEILLDRAHFSPGEIDGKLGENAQKALVAFAEANGLSFDKAVTTDLWDKLAAASDGAMIVNYEIAGADVKGPFLKKLPAKMESMKNLPALNYTSPREALAEKFHMSEELLQAINPGKKFDRAGETIAVANVLQTGNSVPVARVEVDKARQTVQAFDATGKLLAFYPATVGSSEKPTPSGTLKVTAIDKNPTYRYNPKYHFKGVKSKKPFTIRPGPNNPVGSMWINLSAEGYGIHGTADPGRISKAASHGCVRLTNWDAHALAAGVKRGTPVTFLDLTSRT